MATLETQYKNFLINNPDSLFTYEEWLDWHAKQLSEALQKAVDEGLIKNIKKDS